MLFEHDSVPMVRGKFTDDFSVSLQTLHAKELYIKTCSYTSNEEGATAMKHNTMLLNEKMMTVVSRKKPSSVVDVSKQLAHNSTHRFSDFRIS